MSNEAEMTKPVESELSDEQLDKVAGGEDNFPTNPELSDSILEGVAGGVSRPPSGDSNPADLTNTTVGTGDVINPTPRF